MEGSFSLGITSLGKGYYEFSFSSLEDVRRVRYVASWNIDPRYLKLFAWTRDFNPNLKKRHDCSGLI
jgi:hypothetical protein